MKCIECTGADLKSDPKMARMGFCRCKTNRETGKSWSPQYPHDCNDFTAVEAGAVAQRTIWLDAQTTPREEQACRINRPARLRR